jgi:hypothetical protein
LRASDYEAIGHPEEISASSVLAAYSYAMEGSTRETDFVALGKPGNAAALRE